VGGESVPRLCEQLDGWVQIDLRIGDADMTEKGRQNWQPDKRIAT
jgi:hypothetical protein